MTEPKTIEIVDTTMRDGNQSLWGATGLTTPDVLAIAPTVDRVGFRACDFTSSTTSSWAKLSGSPAAMRSCSATRSRPVTSSVTGCSTWMRQLHSRKKCSPVAASTMNSTVPRLT